MSVSLRKRDSRMTKQKTVLTRSNDRKVANLVRTGTKLDKRTGERVPDFQSAIANAFGLPSGITYSCPGATAFVSRSAMRADSKRPIRV